MAIFIALAQSTKSNNWESTWEEKQRGGMVFLIDFWILTNLKKYLDPSLYNTLPEGGN